MILDLEMNLDVFPLYFLLYHLKLKKIHLDLKSSFLFAQKYSDETNLV